MRVIPHRPRRGLGLPSDLLPPPRRHGGDQRTRYYLVWPGSPSPFMGRSLRARRAPRGGEAQITQSCRTGVDSTKAVKGKNWSRYPRSRPMLNLTKLLDPNEREVKRHLMVAAAINELEPELEALDDAGLRARSAKLRHPAPHAHALDHLLIDPLPVLPQ